MKLYFAKKNLPIIIFVSILLTSCLKMALTSAHILDKNISIKYITNGSKIVAFIPMHHIGIKEFYDDAKINIDSFSKNGFTIFYEGVKFGLVKDSLQKDTVIKKMRKIVGLDLIALSKTNGYLDNENDKLLGYKINGLSKYNLVNQPKGIIDRFDTLKFKLIDATYVQLVSECEKKFGAIKLDEYDLKTKSGEKYKSKTNKEMKQYFLAEFRNKLITDSILNEKNNKIVILYGAKHFDGILENLKASDNNFKNVEKP